MTRTPGRAEVILRAQSFDAEEAALLIEQADAANEALYGHPDETPLRASEFDPSNRGLFLVAYVDEQAVACGGYRSLPDDTTGTTAEIKRMFVCPESRRAGLGRVILARLEESARADGYSRVILDVGSKQHAAHALYEAAGYHRIPGFSIYRDRPGNRAYAKDFS